MADIAKLKKKAAEYEQKKQLDKALAEYVKILDEMDSHEDEADVALYNRVGDLMLRQGSASQAVQYYEKAVDLYTEGGFFNNAIALCNKILRNAPGHSAVHYKLGKISAKKGFINDAKQHFLEYADRMQKEGRLEEAFRALKEFADLCPDQDDIRLMLADQLIRRNRKSEAIEQLQLLFEKFQSEGRSREARATVERMRAIDPEIEPKVTGWTPTPKSGDLVFLDVGFGTPASPTPPRGPATAPDGRSIAPPDGLSHGSSIGSEANALDASVAPIAGIERSTMPRSTNGAKPAGADADGPPRSSTPPSTMSIVGRFGGTGLAKVPTDLPLIFPPDEPDDFDTPLAPPARNGTSADAASDAEHEASDPLPTAVPRAHERTPASTLSIDDASLGEAPSLLPEPDWDAPPTVGQEHSSFDDAARKAASAREPAIDFQLEQSAFLTPAMTPAIDAITHDSVGHSESFEASHVDEMPELVDDTAALPSDATSETEMETAVPDLSAASDAGVSASAHAPELDIEEHAASKRDSIDALYGIEERPEIAELHSQVAEPALPFIERPQESIEQRAELIEDPVISIPPAFSDEETSSSQPLIFFVDELDAARERIATGAHDAIAPPPVEDTRTTLERLRDRVTQTPQDWDAHRDLGVALADVGERDEALRVLGAALIGYERLGDFSSARDVARDVALLDPNTLAHHQRHVEFAVKSNERGALLAEAYAGLADALARAGLNDKARAIYARIVDLAPAHARAKEMLERLPEPTNGSLYVTGVMLAVQAPANRNDPRLPTPPAAPAQPRSDEGRFVNLADWLRDDEAPKSTRMITGEPDQTAAANADFAEMLSKFKEGVAANVEDGDHESHYDLGVAYKEMGLLDEAIAEFQKALRGTENRVRTYESLGQCFVEKKQFPIAVTILSRALAGPDYTDDVLVGVLYLLGVATEGLNQRAEAAAYFGRVVAVDIRFRDASARLAALEGARS